MKYYGREDSAVTWKVETYGSRHNTGQTYRLGPVSIVVSAIDRPQMRDYDVSRHIYVFIFPELFYGYMSDTPTGMLVCQRWTV